MKCVYCGAELPEGSVFCANCGAKLEVTAEPVTEKLSPEKQPVAENNAADATTDAAANAANAAAGTTAGAADATANATAGATAGAADATANATAGTTAGAAEAAANAAAGTAAGQQPANQPEKKRGNVLVPILLIIIAILLIAVIVFVIFAVKGSTGGSKVNEKELVFEKDGKLYYVKNMDSDKDPICVCDVRGSYSYLDYTMSEDSKYLYFLDKLDDSGNGDLYRAQLQKLTDNSDKNEKYIVEIESNVSDYQIFSDGKRAVCQKSNGKLVYFDGKESTDVAKRVDSYYWTLNQDESAVIYQRGQDDTYDILRYEFKSGKEETLAEDVEYVIDGMETDDFIVYAKQYDEDGQGYGLYVTDAAGDEEQIARNVANVYGYDEDGKSLYYLVDRRETGSLYDFFEDDGASIEALGEPQLRDFLTPATEQDAMDEYDREYYAEYPEELQYFYDNLYYDNDSGLYYTYNYDDSDTYCYDDAARQWYKLLEDEYTVARDNYENAGEREELIDELKQETIENDYYDLYYWKEGADAVLVAENVDWSSISNRGTSTPVLYNKIETEQVEKTPLSQVDSYYEAWDYYEEAQDAQQTGDAIYYCKGDQEEELGQTGFIYGSDLSAEGDKLVLNIHKDDEMSLMCYDWKNGELKNAGEISDDASMGGWANGVYYYFEDVIDSYGDLYRYAGGKSERILRNIYAGDVEVFEDGNIGVLDNYDERQLQIYAGAKDTKKIGRDVTQYTYIAADRIVYMKNGSLYVYNGKKEDRRIARNVDDYTCHSMNYSWVAYY